MLVVTRFALVSDLQKIAKAADVGQKSETARNRTKTAGKKTPPAGRTSPLRAMKTPGEENQSMKA